MKSNSADPGKIAENRGAFGGRRMLCAILIAGAVLAANFNVLLGDFVWDDHLLTVGNSSIKNLDEWTSLFSQAFLRAYYRPVVMLSFAIEYAVYGLRPWGFHLTNLLLHLANALLVFLLLDRVSRNSNVALIAAVLFAVHPANKAVVMINDRTGLLATLFFLSSLVLYLRHRQAERGGRSLLYYAGSCAAFGLGLFSKEEALTLPLVLIMVDWLFPQEGPAPSLAKRASGYVPFLFLIAFYFGVRGSVIATDMGIADAFMVEPARRLIMVPSILLDYLLTLLLPVRINYDPRIPLAGSIFEAGILIPILLLALLVGILPRLIAGARVEAFGVLWYFVAFVPMCNIVPIYPDVADVELTTPVRYLYLPSVGVFLFAALMFERLLENSRSDDSRALRPMCVAKAALPALCCLVFLFSLLSINRNILWKNEALFYRHVIALSPENHKMHLNLGTIYIQRGKTDAAIEEFRRAVTLAPDRAEYRNSLALAYKAKGWPDRALDEWKEALRLDPDHGAAHAGLATIYSARGLSDEAIAAGRRAVELTPLSYSAQMSLAEAYRQTGTALEAEDHYKAALGVRPNSAEARNGLGAVYTSAGQYASARRELEEALRIRPDFEDARANLMRLEALGH